MKRLNSAKDRIEEYNIVSTEAACLYSEEMKRDVTSASNTVAPRSTAKTSIQHGAFLTRLHGIPVGLEPTNLERSAPLVTPHSIEPQAMHLVSRGQDWGAARLPALKEAPQRLIRHLLCLETLIERVVTSVCGKKARPRFADGLTHICYLPSSYELRGNFLGLLHPFFDGVGEFDGVEPKGSRHLLCS